MCAKTAINARLKLDSSNNFLKSDTQKKTHSQHISTAADTSSLCRFLRDFFLFYNLITLVTADVLVYFWHKYSAEKWIYLQKCK